MNRKIELKQLQIPQDATMTLPLFYQFIQYNRLKIEYPFDYMEYNKATQSFVCFSRPEKPVSKILDYNLLED